jgi:hypothetical protein
MKLLFIKEAIYNGEIIYTPGIHEVASEDFAMRWVRRGIASILHEEKVAEPQTEEPAKIEVELAEEVVEDKPITKAKKKSKK